MNQNLKLGERGKKDSTIFHLILFPNKKIRDYFFFALDVTINQKEDEQEQTIALLRCNIKAKKIKSRRRRNGD